VRDATEESGRDTILIGGSAGAIEAVQQILKPLSSDFPGSLFVVVHTTPEGPGLLARALDRAGGMSAVFPRNGEPIRSGCIYVAPPDHHLMLGADDSIVVRRGPRENLHRPAIDPLFRSAAVRGYGPRSIAVILSGYLDDGSAGL
jgi:two-component system, chemotaxis family, protein-glutamate methylesterase/glutaminase